MGQNVFHVMQSSIKILQCYVKIKENVGPFFGDFSYWCRPKLIVLFVIITLWGSTKTFNVLQFSTMFTSELTPF